ncbi:hypothetical protein E2C01_006140 [Portunus trituberculatus]|uniref:Uncharacterized protein n=1 Tax=Portunus trituberculatus TaxID=210409 RepID=A0A5B7CUD0_PORTR|nr:hypothetical protein [Portunus trituberculatus]
MSWKINKLGKGSTTHLLRTHVEASADTMSMRAFGGEPLQVCGGCVGGLLLLFLGNGGDQAKVTNLHLPLQRKENVGRLWQRERETERRIN